MFEPTDSRPLSEADLRALADAELASRIEAVIAEMRPLERQLDELRRRRDVLVTERRRREKLASMAQRRHVRQAIGSGGSISFAELLETTSEADLAWDAFDYHLRTGGRVRLGFPGARQQTVAFTDGARLVQAATLSEALRLSGEGWEPGSPGRPGVRIHFPGTRQERLVPIGDLYVTAPAAEEETRGS